LDAFHSVFRGFVPKPIHDGKLISRAVNEKLKMFTGSLESDIGRRQVFGKSDGIYIARSQVVIDNGVLPGVTAEEIGIIAAAAQQSIYASSTTEHIAFGVT
jgi:hypothetical protein